MLRAVRLCFVFCQLYLTVCQSVAGISVQMLATAGGRDQKSRSPQVLPAGLPQDKQVEMFLTCRKECIAKCDRLVYVYSPKKEFCHQCIRQCLEAVLQQARSLGIDIAASKQQVKQQRQQQQQQQKYHHKHQQKMLGDAPRDSKRERRRRRRKNRKRRKRRRKQKLLKNCIVQ